jgi:hypothetical protein
VYNGVEKLKFGVWIIVDEILPVEGLGSLSTIAQRFVPLSYPQLIL